MIWQTSFMFSFVYIDFESTVSNVDLMFRLEKEPNSTTGNWWNVAENVTAKYLKFIEELGIIANNGSTTTALVIFTFNDKTFPSGLLSWISGKG